MAQPLRREKERGFLKALLVAALLAMPAPAWPAGAFKLTSLRGQLEEGGRAVTAGMALVEGGAYALASDGVAIVEGKEGVLKFQGPARFALAKGSLRLSQGAVLGNLDRGRLMVYGGPSAFDVPEGRFFAKLNGANSLYVCLCAVKAKPKLHHEALLLRERGMIKRALGGRGHADADFGGLRR